MAAVLEEAPTEDVVPPPPPPPPPPHDLYHRVSCDEAIDFVGIAKRRHLQHPQAAELLQRIVRHDSLFIYNNQTDLFVFDHVLKTSGTSLSRKLLQIFGPDSIVPGSHQSGPFDRNKLNAVLANQTNDDNGKKKKKNDKLVAWWKQQKAMYSHSLILTPEKGRDFQDWLLSKLPRKTGSNKVMKRVLLMTLFRDPIDWMASNFYEWMCKLGNRMYATSKGLYPNKIHPTTHPNGDPFCWGMANLTLLADYWYHHTLPQKCQHDTDGFCRPYNERGEDPEWYCRSIDNLLESSHFRNNLAHHPKVLTKANPSEGTQALEERSLMIYGGLESHSRVPLRWLGLTERYDESLLLFYDMIGHDVDPSLLGTDLKQRFKTCRPLSFWTDGEIERVKKLVSRSYVVHNVANAILDARLAMWCCRRSRLYGNEQMDHATQRFCGDKL